MSHFCFFFCTFCLSLSDNRVSSLKKKSSSKELKALARCVVSFWYSDLPAYTEHYDTFGWSHCGIMGLPCHFQQQYCDLGMLFLTLRLALTPGPKIYINLCLKMKERLWDNEVKLEKWEGRCVCECVSVCVCGGRGVLANERWGKYIFFSNSSSVLLIQRYIMPLSYALIIKK